MHRRDIIIDLIDYFNLNSYLELGIRNSHTFNAIPCNKMSVDMDEEFNPTFCYTTDIFFDILDSGLLNIKKNHKWDIIFIDACHKAEFVLRDIFNSLNHISKKGIIVLHDMLPLKWDYTIEGDQNGTAWKVIPFILKYNKDLHICSVDEKNGGCGILIKNKKFKRELLDVNFNIFYDFYLMDNNREVSQNLIPYEDLIDWIKKPYYDKEDKQEY